VPPYDHRQNNAERAIGIWKDHFVAGLAGLDPNFPMHLWCRLCEQCTQTLNLMRASRINPRLSAEAQLNGAFDYNKTPLAPPGTKVLIHETPENAEHGRHTVLTAGTSVGRRNITGVTVYTRQKQERNASPARLSFFLTTAKCHNYHPQTLPFVRPLTSVGPFETQPLPQPCPPLGMSK